jgi:hypothetical protein
MSAVVLVSSSGTMVKYGAPVLVGGWANLRRTARRGLPLLEWCSSAYRGFARIRYMVAVVACVDIHNGHPYAPGLAMLEKRFLRCFVSLPWYWVRGLPCLG